MIDKLSRTFFCLVVLGVLVLASGCGPTEIEVGRTESGGTLSMAPGDILVVSLPSNPTTGYSWQVIAVDATTLVQQGEPVYVQSPGAGGSVGAGGTEVFRFEAARAGTVTLTLGYLRPWEEGIPPVETFTIAVVIE